MWQRTKRLINSYLDEMIERASSPDREAREVTRAELARLSELEVQTRASAKILEKELAEIDLKVLGMAERERMARAQGDEASALAAAKQVLTLGAERDLIKQQLAEANSAAERARGLREERKQVGEDLATDTHLTAMRENLSSIQTPFDNTDPAATLDEMRARIKRSSGSLSSDASVAEADRQLAAERAKARVDDMLARYKQGLTGGESLQDPSPSKPASPNPDAGARAADEDRPGQSKTLGRSDGPVRPID